MSRTELIAAPHTRGAIRRAVSRARERPIHCGPIGDNSAERVRCSSAAVFVPRTPALTCEASAAQKCGIARMGGILMPPDPADNPLSAPKMVALSGGSRRAASDPWPGRGWSTRGAAPVLETLTDDVFEHRIDSFFAGDDQVRAHEEQVIEIGERLRQVEGTVVDPLHQSCGGRVRLALGVVEEVGTVFQTVGHEGVLAALVLTYSEVPLSIKAASQPAVQRAMTFVAPDQEVPGCGLALGAPAGGCAMTLWISASTASA